MEPFLFLVFLPSLSQLDYLALHINSTFSLSCGILLTWPVAQDHDVGNMGAGLQTCAKLNPWHTNHAYIFQALVTMSFYEAMVVMTSFLTTRIDTGFIFYFTTEAHRGCGGTGDIGVSFDVNMMLFSPNSSITSLPCDNVTYCSY